MVAEIDILEPALGGIQAAVFDQWGVLHEGSDPYPHAVGALERLKASGMRLAVLSNSGKRSKANAERMAAMGFPANLFDCVMTSGEALWQDIRSGRIRAKSLHPITREEGDAETWANGLDIDFVPIHQADAVLLMGLADGMNPTEYQGTLEVALAHALPVLCSNPDRASPRPGGKSVVSPGALAYRYSQVGGTVYYYGKPHLPVFQAVQDALGLPPEKLLMIGDSLEHDIAGARTAGWTSVFVRNGLHVNAFRSGDSLDALRTLARSIGAPLPDFTIEQLR